MTRAEFSKQQIREFIEEFGYEPDSDLSQPAHYLLVKKALKEGKSVPKKVLKDYPELEGGNMKENPLDKDKLKRVMKRAAVLRKKGIKHPLKQAWQEVGSRICPGSKIKSKGLGRGKGLGKGSGPRGLPYYKKLGVSKQVFDEVAAEVGKSKKEVINIFNIIDTCVDNLKEILEYKQLWWALSGRVQGDYKRGLERALNILYRIRGR